MTCNATPAGYKAAQTPAMAVSAAVNRANVAAKVSREVRAKAIVVAVERIKRGQL